jgi:hypothetical protein
VTIPRYHIFSGLDEDAVWVEGVNRLRNAHDRMKKLAAAFPGPYFLYCAQTYAICYGARQKLPSSVTLN